MKIEIVGPGEQRDAGFSARDSRERHQALLMSDGRVGAEEEAFGPAKDCGVGADAEREAENCEDGKTGAAPEHARADAQVHQQMFEPLK